MGRTRIGEKGFSLVEVLVVVVIISILAAIMVPIFLRQREKAWRAATETALKNTSTALVSAAVARGGSFEGISVPDLVEDEGLKYDDAEITVIVAGANSSNYCLSAAHDSWNQTMYWDSAEGRPGLTDCSARY